MSLIAANISCCYASGRTLALQDFSFEFHRGFFYGIFGANGSGKSTLIKLLAGDIKCADKVRVDDVPISAMSPRQRAEKIAVAIQGSEEILPFTIRQSVMLGTYLHPENGEQITDDLLKKWDMSDWAERPFAALSGGEQQKVKILRVLAQNTPYILLDEPAASLDLSAQLDLYGKLQQLAREENKCVIMVSHDLYMAPNFTDTMLLLKSGRLLASGRSEDEAMSVAVSTAFETAVSICRSQDQLQICWQKK